MKNPAVAVLVIALTPIVLLILAFAGTEANKAYWDWQVEGLCREDGGATVYETVTLTENEVIELGGTSERLFSVPEKGSKDSEEAPYFKENKTKYIKKIKSMDVRKSETSFYRSSDQKLMGRFVYFARRGGDFPIGFHLSSFGCFDIEGFEGGVERKIFIVEEGRK